MIVFCRVKRGLHTHGADVFSKSLSQFEIKQKTGDISSSLHRSPYSVTSHDVRDRQYIRASSVCMRPGLYSERRLKLQRLEIYFRFRSAFGSETRRQISTAYHSHRGVARGRHAPNRQLSGYFFRKKLAKVTLFSLPEVFCGPQICQKCAGGREPRWESSRRSPDP